MSIGDGISEAPATAVASRANRANPRQRAQRAGTRDRLIAGALKVFERKSYIHAAIEDVLLEAGVSRASFYAHFAGKAALVEAIADDFAPIWRPLYDELAAMNTPVLATLTEWCTRVIAMYRANQQTCILLTQVAAIEPDLYWKLAGYQDALTEQMAAGSVSLAHLAHDQAARTRATLALSQIDHACYFLAVRRWREDPGPGIEAMAMQLQHFLTSEANRAR